MGQSSRRRVLFTLSFLKQYFNVSPFNFFKLSKTYIQATTLYRYFR